MPFTAYDNSGLSMLGQGLDALGAGFLEQQKKAQLAQLGQLVQTGDYDKAAAAAFNSGQIDLGTKLSSMGQSKGSMSALSSLMGGLYGGGAPAAAPGGLAPLGSGGFTGDNPASQQRSDANLDDATGAVPLTAVATAPNPSAVPAGPRVASMAGGGSVGDFARAIQSNESGGNYGALGPVTRTGDRAYGAYQVMGANIPQWTKEVLGRELTPQEFVSDKAAQDAVFNAKFGQSVAKYGNPQDAASVWFTGRPLAQGANAKDVLGTTGQRYVDKFTAALGGRSGNAPVQFAEAPAATSNVPAATGTGALAMTLPPEAVPTAPMAAPTGQVSPDRQPVAQIDNGVRYSLKAGAQANPNSPATQYTGPAVVEANKDIFINPQTGQPRTVAEAAAMLDGGTGTSVAPATRMSSAPRGVQVASNDPNFVPQDMAGDFPVKMPDGKLWTVAQAAASNDKNSPFDEDVAAAQEAARRGAAMTGGQRPPGTATAAPVAASSASPAQSPAQVSAAAPQALAAIGAPPSLPRALANNPDPQARVRILMQAALLPGLPEQASGLIKTLLSNELDQTKMPEQQKLYLLARSQGDTRSFTDWTDRNQTEKAVRSLTSPEERARYGVEPGYKGTVQVDSSGKLSYPGKASTEVNVKGAENEKAYDVEVAKSYAKTFVETQEKGRDAPGQLNTLRLMEQVVDKPDFDSGLLGEAGLKLRRAAVAIGIADADKAAPQELFAKLSNQSVLDKLGGKLGAGVSNSDVTFMGSTTANLQNTPEGNRVIIKFAKSLAEREIAISKLARQYVQEKGRLDHGFDDRLAQYADANPLVPEQTKAQIQKSLATEAGGAGRGRPNPTASAVQLSPAETNQSLANAKAAISAGKPRDAVLRKLQDAGIAIPPGF